ncbi:hypothetical protein [Paracoccus sp. PAR01]|uniref:hypothetical protein n=1 Tax=Paracoccus TaxID=265 RepID=UPI001CE14A21|nr:hypothetical protein [Paracoccus sp. PAR01]
MALTSKYLAAALVLATLGVAPVAADPGNGKGHGDGNGKKNAQKHEDRGRHSDRARANYVADCPPGLAKKNPPCVPPGQARKYGNRVGDTLRIGDYIVVRDPSRYDLERRRGWEYYRDDDRIYRVDSGTRKVLAVMNVIDAFTN